MSGITRVAAGESSDAVPRARFKRVAKIRPEPAVLARQSAISLLAFHAFDSRDAARAFINENHGALGGRPIEIAGQSDAGFAAVKALLVPVNMQQHF